MEFLLIRDISQLKKHAGKDGGDEFYILLNYGGRSSRHISYSKASNTFYILNYIDSSYAKLTEKDIFDSKITMVGDAINNKCFFKYKS